MPDFHHSCYENVQICTCLPNLVLPVLLLSPIQVEVYLHVIASANYVRQEYALQKYWEQILHFALRMVGLGVVGNSLIIM